MIYNSSGIILGKSEKEYRFSLGCPTEITTEELFAMIRAEIPSAYFEAHSIQFDEHSVRRMVYLVIWSDELNEKNVGGIIEWFEAFGVHVRKYNEVTSGSAMH